MHYNTKCYIVLKKTRWDTFWAVFSQTHLVTLVAAVGAEGFLLIGEGFCEQGYVQ
jgi:uncharacterized membrane protein YbhN (UPF0104 family)